MEKYLTYLTPIGFVIVAIVFAVYKGRTTLTRLKNNAKLAAKQEEAEIQSRIDAAVAVERSRCAENKINEDDRIRRLREIAEEAEMQARLKEKRVQDLQSQVAGLRAEIDAVNTKYKEIAEKYQNVLETNAGLMADIHDIKEKLKALENGGEY